MTGGTPAAGIATITASGADGRSASVGKHGRPCTADRRGLTPHTSPSKPSRSRLSSVSDAYDSGRSVAPTTATERG